MQSSKSSQGIPTVQRSPGIAGIRFTALSYSRTRLRSQAMSDNNLTIGQAAAAAGVHVETIRYYQREALVVEPTKPVGGIRRYDDRFVSRLRFIKRAQQLGFTLDRGRAL